MPIAADEDIVRAISTDRWNGTGRTQRFLSELRVASPRKLYTPLSGTARRDASSKRLFLGQTQQHCLHSTENRPA